MTANANDGDGPDLEALPGFRRTEPQYFKDPMIDRLLEIVMLLGGEVWTLRDRAMVTEQLLATHGRVTPDLIETYRPDPALKEALRQERLQFIRRVFGCLYPDGAQHGQGDHFAWLTEKSSANAPGP